MEANPQRYKWEILQYIGCAVPKISAFQKNMIRRQLNERYCSECGEYIYNPFPRRNIRHFHHRRIRHHFVPLVKKRIQIHPHNQLVEWTRRFPHVMKLLISEKDFYVYKHSKPQFVHRLPAIRMWTLDEWNTLYPDLYIWKHDCIKRIQSIHSTTDCLFTPDLMIL